MPAPSSDTQMEQQPPSVIEPEAGEAARPLARLEGRQEQVQREQRGEIETGPLRRRIDDFAG
jgi:hypothetical protein